MEQFSLLKADLMQESGNFDPMRLHERVKRHSLEIANLMNEKFGQIRVRRLIIEEIKAATDGNMILPHYIPRSKSQQELFIYNGTHWEPFDLDQYFKMVRDCSIRIGLPEDQLSCTIFANRLYEDVAHALHHPISYMVPKNEVWINLQNGTLKITQDGAIRLDSHCREDFFLYALPYAYDPEATCPMWQKYLSEALPDHNTQRIVQEFAGCCFTKHVKIEKMLVLKGHGSNGKSVFMNVVTKMFGLSNVSTSELSDITNNDERRRLIENKLVNISSENNKQLNTSVLKQLISGESVDIRPLYKGSRPMYDYGRFITSYNQLPQPEQTNAFFRRWLLIPFKQTFIEGKNADKFLDEKIIASELPGVLNWTIAGLLRLIKNGYNFTESEECTAELTKYRKSGDSVAIFIDSCCTEYNNKPTLASELLARYKAFCHDEGLKDLPKNTFYKHLEENLHIARHNPGHVPFFELTLQNE